MELRLAAVMETKSGVAINREFESCLRKCRLAAVRVYEHKPSVTNVAVDSRPRGSSQRGEVDSGVVWSAVVGSDLYRVTVSRRSAL